MSNSNLYPDNLILLGDTIVMRSFKTMQGQRVYDRSGKAIGVVGECVTLDKPGAISVGYMLEVLPEGEPVIEDEEKPRRW